eukprot:364428-Chlamydomonas_euryale.AAC.7
MLWNWTLRNVTPRDMMLRDENALPLLLYRRCPVTPLLHSSGAAVPLLRCPSTSAGCFPTLCWRSAASRTSSGSPSSTPTVRT